MEMLVAQSTAHKRERLAAAAAQLVLERGLDGATIAAIADLAGVPQGSVYYALRTKAEIAQAAAAHVAAQRRDSIETWDAAESAVERLVAYLEAASDTARETARTGSLPTLAGRLRGVASEAAETAATAVRETIAWAARQFEEMGFSADAAQARALHLVSGIEGAGELAHALGDPLPITREAAHLSRWVANARSSS